MHLLLHSQKNQVHPSTLGDSENAPRAEKSIAPRGIVLYHNLKDVLATLLKSFQAAQARNKFTTNNGKRTEINSNKFRT